MGGRFTFPLGGYYHATKYAVEALTDALRIEVQPFGVDVALIEPGVTRTGFEDNVHSSDAMAPGHGGLPLCRAAGVGRQPTTPALLQPA